MYSIGQDVEGLLSDETNWAIRIFQLFSVGEMSMKPWFASAPFSEAAPPYHLCTALVTFQV